MKQPLDNRFDKDVEEKAYYEINLPTYLQDSLDRWKYEETNSLIDCFYEDFYSSINIAEDEDEISVNHVQYLRSRFLGL